MNKEFLLQVTKDWATEKLETDPEEHILLGNANLVLPIKKEVKLDTSVKFCLVPLHYQF